jgi:hypothetical protein
MKSLFVTLLILGAVFAGYDYFLARPWERAIFEKGPKPAAVAQPTMPDHVVEDDGPMPPAPTAKPTDNWQPSVTSLPSKEFTPPVLQSVETITQNWKVIPKQAFPRPVILKKDVQAKMSVGSSTLRAGATVQAISADQGILTIAPTETSPARGSLPITDTDFPEQIQASYEKWKIARIDQARQVWLGAKTIKTGPSMDKSTLSNGLGIKFGSDGKPEQNPDGSYNLLLGIISSGRVTDVDPNKVTHWGIPELQTVDGKPTWVIPVRYETKTIFGLMEVNSRAFVRDQQLLRWVYESGEPLP